LTICLSHVERYLTRVWLAATVREWDGVLVRFGEIGIKSAPVRRRMLGRLASNIEQAMLRAGVEGGVSQVGSLSPARRVPSGLRSIQQACVELALRRQWKTFAIRARREGQHTYSSQDVNVQAGSAVFVAAQQAGRDPKVDLGHPDLTIDVDVRQAEAFVFTDHVEGPGGIPVGTQGKVVALLSDEASLVAAWLMMRRGCDIVPVSAGKALAPALATALRPWGMVADIRHLPVASVSKPVLIEAAGRIAQREGALAIVTGETLDSALVGGDVPVLRPVCGLDPEEFRRIRDRIGVPAFAAPGVLQAASPTTVEQALGHGAA
jgi:adenylyl- and sulfurtransferase ThiI